MKKIIKNLLLFPWLQKGEKKIEQRKKLDCIIDHIVIRILKISLMDIYDGLFSNLLTYDGLISNL